MTNHLNSSVRTRIGVSLLALAALAMLALTIALPRYQLTAVSQGAGIYKLDTWTGKTWYCSPWYSGFAASCIEHADFTPQSHGMADDLDFDAADRMLQQQKTTNAIDLDKEDHLLEQQRKQSKP